MEILLITDRSDLNLRIEAILKSVLLDNKLVVESPKSNISFLLTNILLERKGHLDLIIIDDYELNIPSWMNNQKKDNIW
jgi:hypothetical protein